MPRFHFSIYEGVSPPDVRGLDLPGSDEAQIEAVRLAGGLLRDKATQRRLGQGWRMEVTDDAGILMFRLDFTVTGAGHTGLSPP